ncbi:hypothetical protein PsorP6_014012 [Peronosclerospora sorghi]|uniref:Uncharacterized protein n=1 Tax=Peronosclerospora sorghi TaxID=230839 RepID=A0ACC0VHY1_9STRA|nr:hypothetical protein PsorP6_014012 [Peronosclerospora sorghi]
MQLAKQVEEKYVNGRLPAKVDQESGKMTSSKVTFGSDGGSYYEYIVNQRKCFARLETLVGQKNRKDEGSVHDSGGWYHRQPLGGTV